ncbi:MAG: polysaccharide export protein [Kiritimatiellae bacterium]|nr:polysaccharide export protein [Kiritimatiellia bacterium]
MKEDELSLILRFVSLILLCFSLVGLSGCGLFDLILPDSNKPGGYDQQAEYVEEGEPRIKSGLTLRVSVTASGSAAVQEVMKEVDLNGEILLPLIGAVKCEGLTVVELQTKISKSYEKYFIDPQVSVNFAYTENGNMKSPWGSILMMGEITRPGPVNMPSTRDLNVVRALMMAGGVTPMADKRKVRVTRREKSGELKRFIVDIEKIGKDGRSDLDIILKPGDVVWVPESWY